MSSRRGKQVQTCQICEKVPFKYSCSGCRIVYCSVACFKEHKANSCNSSVSAPTSSIPLLAEASLSHATPPDDTTDADATREPENQLTDLVGPPDAPALRPLTSLRWPYVPEAPSYPDPLAQEEAKPLQLTQYEAIATSINVRRALENNSKIKQLLRSIDALQGNEREWELEKILGVALDANGRVVPGDAEDMKALRELAEAVEEVVRGDEGGTSAGLDWGDIP